MSIDFGGVAGGIGKGLMMGSQFVAQRNDAKKQQDYRDEMLGMQQQTHAAQMQMNNYQMENLERQKKANEKYSALINSDRYKNSTSPFDRQQMVIDEIAEFADPETHSNLMSQAEALRQQFGEERLAFASTFDNWEPLMQEMQKKYPGLRYEIKDGVMHAGMGEGAELKPINLEGVATVMGYANWANKQAQAKKAALDNQYRQAQISKEWADTEKSRASATKLGTSGTSTSSEPKLLGGFKTSGDEFDWIKNSIPESGLNGQTSAGKALNFPRETAAQQVQMRYRRLVEDNPGVDQSLLLDAAIQNYLHGEGVVIDGGNYEPTYGLNQEGKEVPYIRTKGGENLIYNTPTAKRDTNRLLDAQDRWLSSWRGQAKAEKIRRALSDEGVRDQFILGLSDPEVRRSVEGGYDGIYEYAPMLYARGLLPEGVTISAPGYEEALQVYRQRERQRAESKVPKLRIPRGVPRLTPEDIADLQERNELAARIMPRGVKGYDWGAQP